MSGEFNAVENETSVEQNNPETMICYITTPMCSTHFSGLSEQYSCHRPKSGQDRSRQTIGVASRGKENDKRWHAHHQEALSSASHRVPPSVNQSEKDARITNQLYATQAMWLIQHQKIYRREIILKLTTPGARKAVTLLYFDKSVYEEKKETNIVR